MASLWADRERLAAHLRSDDFFDVENFPTAVFSSTGFTPSGEGKFLVTGNLNLHGVERELSFAVTVNLVNGLLHAESEFSLNRQHWNISYPGMPDDLIRDEVVIRFKIDGLMQ